MTITHIAVCMPDCAQLCIGLEGKNWGCGCFALVACGVGGGSCQP